MKSFVPGFTMVETAISTVIASIAILGIVLMTYPRSPRFSRRTSEASTLAAHKLATLRAMTVPTSGTAANVDQHSAPGGTFSLKWTVSLRAAYTEATVRVGWNEEDTSDSTCLTDSDCSANFCSAGACFSHAVVVSERR